MEKIITFIIKKNKFVLITSFIVMIIGIILASGLKVETKMEDMLPKDNDVLNASFQIDEEFGGQDQVLIAVEILGDGTKEDAIDFMNRLKVRLESERLTNHIFYKTNIEFLEQYAYLYLPTDSYQKLDIELNNPDSHLSKYFSNPEDQTNFINLYEERKTSFTGETLNQFENLYNKLLTDELTEDEQELFYSLLIFGNILENKDMQEISDEGYIVSEDESLYLMMVKPNINFNRFVEDREIFFSKTKEIIQEMTTSELYNNKIDAGLTGGQMVQDYESDKVAFESFLGTSIGTFLLIMLFMVVSFRRLILPIASGYPLLLGTILSAAFAFIVFDGISIFSLSFAVLLLGLGIDFAIHIISRYSEERFHGKDIHSALKITLKKTGVGIIIGALTTATAFLMFIFADFKAFSQMGIISVAGIILALISMLTIVPALIVLFDGKLKKKKEIKNTEYTFLKPITNITTKYPIYIILIVIILAGTLIPNVMNTKINSDLSQMYPENIPSVKWMDKVQNHFDYEPDILTIQANNLDEVKTWTNALENKDNIKDVSSVLDILPSDQQYKIEVLEKYPALKLFLGKNELKPLTIDDLPEDIKSTYIGNTGKLKMEITSTNNIWDKGTIKTLNQDVKEITGQQITGMPVVMEEVIQLVMSDVSRIGLLSLIIIFIFLLIIFRSIKYALLTLIPVILTLIFMLGLTKVIGIDINIMNIMMIPLIIGIGVDSGVHITHRIKEGGSNQITNSVVHTGKAVILSSMTTLIGFGSLIFANHPGLESIGQFIVLGMALCITLTLILLPALLKLFSKKV